jgi:molybdopterin-guanine dinucleotide biosynthesis protein A
MNLAVVVLAGGKGARIGGGKPLRMLGGQRLIDRALEQARRWSGKVAIAVRDDAQVQPIDASLIRDDPHVEGPLGGLVAALGFAHDQGCEFLLTIPSDMPFLPSELSDQLARALRDSHCALASSCGHIHPVCGLWRTSSLDSVQAYVASGRRSLRGFAETIGHAVVEWPNAPLDPFFNVNSSEDLAEAERLLEG